MYGIYGIGFSIVVLGIGVAGGYILKGYIDLFRGPTHPD